MRAKNIRFLLSSVSFCLILYMLLYTSSLVFMPKEYDEQSCLGGYNTNGYRGEMKNSIDVLLIGNSNVYSGFAPIEFWRKHGVTSYVSGKALQSPAGAYGVLKDSLKYQSPKLVAIEMDCFYTGVKSRVKVPKMPKDIKSSLRKAKCRIRSGFSGFHNLDAGLGTAIGYWMPVVKYHGRWKELEKNDVLNIKGNWHFSGKGFIASSNKEPYNGGLSYMGKKTDKVQEMSKSNKKYLEKMIDLCEERNIKVVLFSIPSASSWNYQRHNGATQFAENHNLNYFDLNLDCSQWDLDWTKDSRDAGQHLNVFGAVKLTDHFGSLIKDEYSLKPQRNKAIHNSWKVDSQKYDKILKASICSNTQIT